MVKIGILAIQGSVIEHRDAVMRAAAQGLSEVADLGCEVVEIRLPKDLLTDQGRSKVDGIILPGGESTTQAKLLRRFELVEPLKDLIKNGLPAWGTCAGAILLSKQIIDPDRSEKSLELMDISAERNAYGTQLDSFVTNITANLPGCDSKEVEAVFIRAPRLKPLDSLVQVLAEHQGEQIALKQGNMMVTSFHPELTNDSTFHSYFLSIVRAWNSS